VEREAAVDVAGEQQVLRRFAPRNDKPCREVALPFGMKSFVKVLITA
jgi:hypothetical protein